MEWKSAAGDIVKELDRLRQAIKEKDEEINRLNNKTNGGHECGGYCEICKHSYEIKNPLMNFPMGYGCLLNCKCKDFTPKE